MGYERLLNVASEQGLSVYESPFRSKAKGLLKGKIIGIDNRLPIVEKACVLAEELGHYQTGVGDSLNQSDLRNRKQELRARQWAYFCMLPLEKIVEAHHSRISGRYDLAEYLGVTEEFLQSAITRFTDKFGLAVRVDERHTIIFDPLGVIEHLE